MKVHELKTWPEPYEALRLGLKTFEVRVNDRDFQVGDVLELAEFDPVDGEWLQRHPPLFRVVTYMTRGGLFGLPDNMVVMSLARLPERGR